MGIEAAQVDRQKTVDIGKTIRKKVQIHWLMLLAVPLLFILVFYVYPISGMFLRSFFSPEFTLTQYVKIFDQPAYLKVLVETFKMSATVTLLSLLLGYPVAYLLSQVSPRVRNLLLIMVVLPFLTAILVRTYAWMVILGRNGILNQILMQLGIVSSPLRLMHNLFSVYLGMVQVLLPFMILPLYSVMAGIDRRLMRAAENLGANPFQVFLRIFLPLSLPGVGGGCLLVFIIGLGFFITPALLGGPSDVMISMFIETQVHSVLDFEFASALAVLLLGVTLVIFAIYSRFFGVERMVGQ
jgi:ABC-type spermidine/putrescine transport system permease subunit I